MVASLGKPPYVGGIENVVDTLLRSELKERFEFSVFDTYRVPDSDSEPPPESIIRGAIGFVVRGSPAADETRARPHPFLQRDRLLEARDLFGRRPLARGQDYLPFARRRLRSLLERNDALAEVSHKTSLSYGRPCDCPVELLEAVLAPNSCRQSEFAF